MFVTVEGLDGSGTTTLVESFEGMYDNTVTTSEPSDLEYGRLIRRNLSEDTDPIVDFFLFMADRRNHIEERVRPAERDGKLVISDRYVDSTRAYQPVALAGDGDEPFDSPWEAKAFIEKAMVDWHYEPDLTLYLEISVDTALERSAGDEKYEKREFLKQVKQNYDALHASNDRIVQINAEQSIDEVQREAFNTIESFI